ncbi:Fe-S protein assembly co-chaperone HscB [Moraxella cuniculi]|uniref:Hsc20 n=1 Tax=Moraxella cuniculi TaxID=34061 RepID=A0A3S5EFX6_9GAMM|nr:Fe-S protein assembly co-chaperone HscB [Moraxella cuniculi]VEG13185.1 Hsc20 [Moraxella cuniculi]
MSDAHFFALFGLPVDFNIDKQALKQAHLALQKQHHPDRNTANHGSNQQASLINHAYQTLLADDSRADYLLQLSGVVVDASESIADWEFLDSMMQLRIELDDTSDNGKLAQIAQQVGLINQAQAQRFIEAYGNQNWSQAIDASKKLQFTARLLDDIANKTSENLAKDNTDDELYV